MAFASAARAMASVVAAGKGGADPGALVGLVAREAKPSVSARTIEVLALAAMGRRHVPRRSPSPLEPTPTPTPRTAAATSCRRTPPWWTLGTWSTTAAATTTPAGRRRSPTRSRRTPTPDAAADRRWTWSSTRS